MSEQDKLNMLAEYLGFLKSEQKLDIVVFDRSGMFATHDTLDRVLQPYLNHTNPYCMHVKSNQTLWAHCIILKERVLQRCSRHNQAFFGTCHCGVGEYVQPLWTRTGLTGFISATGYRAEPDLVAWRLPATARKYNLDADSLQSIYDQAMRPREGKPQQVGMQLSLLAWLLRAIVDETLTQDNTLTSDQGQPLRLIARALDYINEMYANNLTLEEIARYCNCSKSHLQHLFQTHRRQTVWQYLQAVRMEKARRLLVETEWPISHLAAMIGFNDANYFSTVFSRKIGLSPRRYRQMNRAE
ncbi:MAG: AraC family transcriptional regulator [Bacillota bacterium]|nr:AraC family transcriptional regulator [Bacillota bacterium]